MTNFEVKIRLNDPPIRLRPGLSCTAEIQTDLVKDVVSVPIQSVTIRTGDTNLSPEEIEQKKVLKEAEDKADNNAEVENERLAKAEPERRARALEKSGLSERWRQSQAGRKSQPGSRTIRTSKSKAV